WAYRTGFSRFLTALEPLDEAAAEGPLLASAELLYRPDTDIAILALQLDLRSTTTPKILWLRGIAAAADLPMLDPSSLGERDRRAFLGDYLSSYQIRIEASDGPREALEELARIL